MARRLGIDGAMSQNPVTLVWKRWLICCIYAAKIGFWTLTPQTFLGSSGIIPSSHDFPEATTSALSSVRRPLASTVSHSCWRRSSCRRTSSLRRPRRIGISPRKWWQNGGLFWWFMVIQDDKSPKSPSKMGISHDFTNKPHRNSWTFIPWSWTMDVVDSSTEAEQAVLGHLSHSTWSIFRDENPPGSPRSWSPISLGVSGGWGQWRHLLALSSSLWTLGRVRSLVSDRSFAGADPVPDSVHFPWFPWFT